MRQLSHLMYKTGKHFLFSEFLNRETEKTLKSLDHSSVVGIHQDAPSPQLKAQI